MFKFSKIFGWLQFWHPEKIFKLYLKDIEKTCKRDLKGKCLTYEGRQTLYCVSFILFTFFIRMIQYFSLLFCQNSFYRLITYDTLIFFNCPSSMSIFHLSFISQLFYFLHRGYFYADNCKKAFPILLIYRVLYHNDNNYFLYQYKTKKKDNGTNMKKLQKKKQAESKVKWSFVLKSYLKNYQWLYEFCFIFFVTYIAIFHCISLYYIYNDWEFYLNTFFGFMCLLYLLFNSLYTDYWFIHLGMVDFVASSVALSFSLIFFLRLKQTNTILNRKRLNKFYLYRFTSFHSKTLVNILYADKYFGSFLLWYIICIMPLSALIVMGLACGGFNTFTRGYFSMFLVFIYDGIIGFHWLVCIPDIFTNVALPCFIGKCLLKTMIVFQQKIVYI